MKSGRHNGGCWSSIQVHVTDIPRDVSEIPLFRDSQMSSVGSVRGTVMYIFPCDTWGDCAVNYWFEQGLVDPMVDNASPEPLGG